MAFFDTLTHWLILGGIIAIIYSLRYIVLLERRLVAIELSVKRLVKHLEEQPEKHHKKTLRRR